MEFLFNIFKEYLPEYWALHGETFPILLRAIGYTLVAVNFMIFGSFIFLFAKRTNEGRTPDGLEKRRILLVRLLGLFIFFCGFSRAVQVYSIWHNIAIFEGLISLMTGLFSLGALMILPSFIQLIKRNVTLHEVKDELQKTREEVETLNNISKNLDNTENK